MRLTSVQPAPAVDPAAEPAIARPPGSVSAPAEPEESALRRTMTSRHLVMIALGGVIGSGLFVSSGYTVSQAGPLGAVLATASARSWPTW